MRTFLKLRRRLLARAREWYDTQCELLCLGTSSSFPDKKEGNYMNESEPPFPFSQVKSPSQEDTVESRAHKRMLGKLARSKS